MSLIAAHTGECNVDGLQMRWAQDSESWKLTIRGMLRLGNGRALFDSFVDFIDEHHGKLEIDMQHLRVDSNGLGSLVRAASVLGSRTRFQNLNGSLLSLMELCKLLTVLPVEQKTG